MLQDLVHLKQVVQGDREHPEKGWTPRLQCFKASFRSHFRWFQVAFQAFGRGSGRHRGPMDSKLNSDRDKAWENDNRGASTAVSREVKVWPNGEIHVGSSSANC